MTAEGELRIAIIDDNENDRALVKRELKRAIERVAFIDIIDRASFDRLMQDGGFDAIITDYQFGWSNGLEILKIAKLRYPDHPVIMFTATANEETVVEAMKSGLDDYVVKSPKRFIRIPVALRLSLQHAAARRAQRIAEERTQAALRELSEQQAWFYTTLNSIATGVIATDREGRIRFMNPVAERLTGWPAPEAVGRGFEEIAWLLGETGEPLSETPVTLALQNDPGTADGRDCTLISRDGSRITVINSSTPIRKEDGSVLGVVMVLRDITDRQRLARELARSNEELAQFTYAAAHDLREPLRTVIAFTELFRERRPDLPGKDAQVLSYVLKGARRMEELVEGLLRYGQAAHAAPQFTEVSTDEVLKSVTASLRRRLQENYASVEWNGLPRVRADRNQLSIVFQNLISNAVKYRTNAPPRIHVSVDGGHDEWRFCVSDNGIGIAPRHQSQIFQIFTRLHPHEFPGAGIGLSICRRIVESHDGRMWVESEEGSGSRFYFTLPKR